MLCKGGSLGYGGIGDSVAAVGYSCCVDCVVIVVVGVVLLLMLV